MRRHLFLLAIGLTTPGTLIGAPLPIPVRNYSFEQPGTGKTNMSGVPGWRFDGAGTPLAGVKTLVLFFRGAPATRRQCRCECG